MLLIGGGVFFKAVSSLTEASLGVVNDPHYIGAVRGLTIGGLVLIAVVTLIAVAPIVWGRLFRKSHFRVAAAFSIYLALFIGVGLLKGFLRLGISQYMSQARIWLPIGLLIFTAFEIIGIRDRKHPKEACELAPVMVVLLGLCLLSWLALPYPEEPYLNNLIPAMFILGSYYLYRCGGGIKCVPVKRLDKALVFVNNMVIYGFFFVYFVMFGALRGFIDVHPVEGKRYRYADLVRIEVPTMRVRVPRELAREYEEMYRRIGENLNDNDRDTELMFSPKRANVNFIASMKYPTYINNPVYYFKYGRGDPEMYRGIVGSLEKKRPKFIAVVNYADYDGNGVFKGEYCGPANKWESGLTQELTDYIRAKYKAIYEGECYHVFAKKIIGGE
jgi:hypothetical protein